LGRTIVLAGALLLAAPPAFANETAGAEKLALAVRLERGQGMPRSYARALQLYCEAAEQGSAAAAYGAAWMFLNGIGMRKNTPNGIAWLRVAAKGGNPDAKRWLELVGNLTVPKPPHCRATFATARTRQAPPAVVEMVNKAAAEFELDPNLVLSVMAIESGFQSDAVSPKNAKGLMQLTDETAKRFGVKDVFEPADNIRGGARYLQWLIQYFDGDLARALAGYNAGEQAVVRYGGVPPYAETRAYLEKIRSRYPVDSPP
jgi:soluble lytic murein transglycosylase-like protein